MTSDSTAKAKRSEATDARRLAPMFPLDSDREKLLRHAKELEGEADALDLEATAAAAEPDQPQAEQQEAEQQEAEQQEAERQEPEAQADTPDLQAGPATEPGLVDQRQPEQQQQQSDAADRNQGPPPLPKPR
jgi:hypothetical protein